MKRERPYLRPSWLVSRVINPILMRLRLVTTLVVRGRRTGQWRWIPVNVLELGGTRYLISPRGSTEWVRNLRAAGEGQLRRGSRVETFRATEVPDEEKPSIIEAYLQRWGGRSGTRFEALPDPADHPVFRVEPTQ